MTRIWLLYWLSGFVSLGYQVFWFRHYVDAFGSTNLTFVLVLCNFIGGLAAGSLASQWVGQRLARWLRTDVSLRLYGVVELLVVAALSLTLLSRLTPADAWGPFPYQAHDGIYYQTTFYQLSKIVIGTLSVFTPCFFMGVTFPLLCHCFRADGAFPATLYGWNTFGACTAVVVCEFLFLPWLGHDQMLWILAALNVVIGLFFLVTGAITPQASDAATETPRQPAVAKTKRRRKAVPHAPTQRSSSPRVALPESASVLMTAALLSGFVTGAFEGDMFKRIRFLATDYTATMSFISFWAILGIFLASWTVRAWPGIKFIHLKGAFLLAAIYHFALWKNAYPIREAMMRHVYDPYLAALPRPLLPGDQEMVFPTSLAQLFLFVGLFVLPPFYLISLLLPYVCNRLQTQQRHLGLAYGANTLMFCLGIVAFTWLAPLVNVFYSLKLFMALMFIVAGLLLGVSESKPLAAWKPVVAAAVAGAAVMVTPRGFDRTYVLPNSPQAHYEVRALNGNGAHTTYVTSDPEGDYLCFDNHLMSGTNLRAQTYMRLMAHFPLLAHPHPTEVLLICFGVGNTASAIATHDTVEHLDVVDLNTNVIENAGEFAASNRQVYLDPRVRFVHDDGRNFLKLTDQTYDLVTSEPPPPLFSGVYRLYSREYYQEVLAHLRPDGMMTQWLPAYQLSPKASDLIIRTFVDVFPHTLMFVGYREEYILLGSRSPIDLKNIERRIHLSSEVHRDLQRIGNGNAATLIARVIRTGDSLRRQVGPGAAITDAKNELAQQFANPYHRVAFAYDPEQTLPDLAGQRLACYDQLQRIVTHLGRLIHHVRDFPDRMILSAKSTAKSTTRRPVRLAELDWRQNLSLMNEASAAMRDGRSAEAIRFYQQALKISDQVPTVWYGLAELYNRTGQLPEALDAYEHFRKIEPEDPLGYLDSGKLLLSLGQLEQAEAMLRRAKELDPDSAEAECYLGFALQSQGQHEEARLRFRGAIENRPEWSIAWNALALNLATQREATPQQRKLAVEMALKANELNNYQDVRMIGTLIEAYAAAGRYQDAVQAAVTALQKKNVTATEKIAQDRIRQRLQAIQELAKKGEPD